MRRFRQWIMGGKMGLNKQKGNMYPWCSHTLTILNGACPHQCTYCYVSDLRRYPTLAARYSGPPRLVESDLELNLGNSKTIFVCSTSDLFAWGVPREMIEQVLVYLRKFPDNRYFFQTKNPYRFWQLVKQFPPKTLLGITLETNRDYPISKAPKVRERVGWFGPILPFPRMVSIEPILDFDVEVLADWVRSIAPEFVSVGADSKHHNLPEPPAEKIRALIAALEEFTEVKVKSNLGRLLKEKAP